MGHPLELSSIELNHVEEWISHNYNVWSENIIFKGNVMTKRKSESKWTSSIMVITQYHILIFSEGKEMTKKPPKDHHIYDIKALNNKVEFVLTILFQKGKQKTKLKFKSDAMQAILCILRKLKHTQNGDHCQAELTLNVKSSTLLAATAVGQSSSSKVSTVDSFTDIYRGWCSYYQSSPHMPLISLLSKMIVEENREIDLYADLQTSEHSDIVLDMVPLLNALRHDRFFIGLTLRDLKKEAAVKALSELVLHNRYLKKLSIRRCGSEALHSLFLSLSLNKKNAIQILDVSENALSSKATTSLVSCMQQFTHALVHLDLSNCQIPAKQLTALFEAFEKNYGMSLTLEYLNLSHNRFDDQTNYAFSSWIIKSQGYSKLRHILLSGSNLSPYSFYAMKYLTVLEHIDISNNKLEVGGELDKLLPILSIPTLHRLDCNNSPLSKEVLALIICKMSDKKPSVHLEFMGLNLVNAEDNFDMLFNALSLFRDSENSIKVLNLRHARGTEKTILSLLQTLSDIKVNELILDGLSVVYPQQNSSSNNSSNNDNFNDSTSNPFKETSSNTTGLASTTSPHSQPMSNSGGGSNGITSNAVNNRLVFSLATSIDLNSSQEDERHHDSHSHTHSHGLNGADNDNNNNHVGEVAAGLCYNQSLSFDTLFAKSLLKLYMNPELRTLSLASVGKIMALIPYFGKNSSVTSLDISRNQLGDQGAILLAHALASNRSMLAINIDANAITNVGWNEILLSLTENGKTPNHNQTKESPNLPPTSATSPTSANANRPRLHSMIYPRYDFEKLIVATDDPVRRVSIYLLISKIQMALIGNGNLFYSDRRNCINAKLPVGFTIKKQDQFFPQTPTVLYPRTPIPPDILANEKLKVEQHRNGNPPSAISTLAQFLKVPVKLNKTSVINAINPNNVVIGPPTSTTNNTSIPKKPIHHIHNYHVNNHSPAIITPIVNSNKCESPSVQITAQLSNSKSERNSPVPFSSDEPSSHNIAVTNTLNSIMNSPKLVKGVSASLSLPAKSNAYPAIPSFDNGPGMSVSTTTTTTASAPPLSIAKKIINPKLSRDKLNYRASGSGPVTHDQIFDAIQSLELATNYCNNYTTPPISPSKSTADGQQSDTSPTKKPKTILKLRAVSQSSPSSAHTSTASLTSLTSTPPVATLMSNLIGASAVNRVEKSPSTSSENLIMITKSSKRSSVDSSVHGKLFRKVSLSASTSSSSIADDVESSPSNSSISSEFLNINQHNPFTRVRSQSVLIPTKLDDLLASNHESPIVVQSSTSSLDSL